MEKEVEDTKSKEKTRAEKFIKYIQEKGFITDDDVKKELTVVAKNIANIDKYGDNTFVLSRTLWRRLKRC